MDSDSSHEQLDLGSGEEYEANNNLESVVLATAELSAGGEEQMTYSDESKDDILDKHDPKENADQKEDGMDSEKSKADILNNKYPKEIATRTEISSVAPFVSSSEAENKPVTKTPSVKGLNCVSDDKENVDRNGMKLEQTEEEAKKNKLHDKSLRELTKMLKEKLQISKNTADEIGGKVRPSLLYLHFCLST